MRRDLPAGNVREGESRDKMEERGEVLRGKTGRPCISQRETPERLQAHVTTAWRWRTKLCSQINPQGKITAITSSNDETQAVVLF